ncbi:MAG: tRNA (adenosine(37)-N6)-dimethylallyltransferase MiaA [Candidatus Tectomicrobia bacterium]|uniref:tRNA dimethylallyltransferase n=1 Tax=Tectimicrobiota bacterium TaxID=2528274 RepID=A0A932CLG0_UNCTE|nr:tRNA (adenosine(37)-N6)-dimethylallyltransferase MiaA [Candidatus Tectomicrobia bacterium]
MKPIPSACATGSLPILFIVGPTGVGKTRLAIQLARHLQTEIISADSRQVYRLLDIGTAKPTAEEQQLAPHHLIDLVWPDQEFSVADYLAHFREVLGGFLDSHRLPLVVGGTGLYVQAVTRGLFEGPGADWDLRQELEELAQKNGPLALHLRLQEIDPAAAQAIHPHDRRRIIRALEVYQLTQTPISCLQREKTSPELSLPFVTWGLMRDRPDLYERIERRVDLMLEIGLEEEVQGLLERGYPEGLNALQAFGYRDLIGYLRGRQTRAEAIQHFKRDTRRYAKRQLTWFAKEGPMAPSTSWSSHPGRIHWFNLTRTPEEEVLASMIEMVGSLRDGR